MSSILKALKKLEQETAENAGTPITSGVIGRPKKRAGSLVIPGLVAFTLCIFIGVGVMIFTQYTPTSESPTSESPNSESPTSESPGSESPGSESAGPASIIPKATAVLENDEKSEALEIVPAEKIPAPKKAAAINNRKQPGTVTAAPEFAFSTSGTSIPAKQLVGVKKDVPKLPSEMLPEMEMPTELPGYEYATATGKTADSFSPVMADPGVVNEKRLPIEEDPEPIVGFQPRIGADESSVSGFSDSPERKKSFVDMPVVKKAEPAVAVIKDPSIELQAISWSSDPAKRLAIINGKICREKDHVSGYMIQAIKSDEVILAKGSVKGKLVFEIR